MNRANTHHTELLQRFAASDRRALARVITLVQAGQLAAEDLPAATHCNSSGRRPLVVGITGSGGAGKSTLIGALVGLLRGKDLSVAVLANDPNSPLTGGALLGDRLRIAHDADDAGVYIRSTSTRGAQGGVAESTPQIRRVLEAFGFDVILIETVGVGQDQSAVRSVVDRLVLVATPGAGDEIQWEKAGVIEVADVVAINKSDLPGAERVQADLVRALSLSSNTALPPVLLVSATERTGLEELWEAIDGAGQG